VFSFYFVLLSNLAIGAVKVTYFYAFYGHSVDELMATSVFPNGGSHTGRLDNFESAVQVMEKYGILMQTYFIAPLTGGYVFHASSDDDSKVFLSTDSNEAAKVLIIHVPNPVLMNDFR